MVVRYPEPRVGKPDRTGKCSVPPGTEKYYPDFHPYPDGHFDWDIIVLTGPEIDTFPLLIRVVASRRLK
jgi:hypothetical protein